MWVLKSIFWIVLIAVVATFTLAVAVLDDAPTLTARGTPSPEDVAATRSFVKDVRRAAEVDGGGVVEISEVDANGILRVAARFLPEGRARVRVLTSRVFVQASVPVPWIGGQKWVNVEAMAPAFEGRPTLDYLRVAGYDLPPAVMIEAARLGANWFVGNEAGDVFLGAADRLEIDGDRMQFSMSLGEADRKGFMRGLFGAMRGADMPPLATMDAYYDALREAIDDGRLPDAGSYLPHLKFMLARVYENSTDETLANEFTAAIFALAKACGARDFALVVGRLIGDPLGTERDFARDCTDVLFADRDDSRRHFTTAAAIQAASNRGVSVSIGEFKELYDSRGWKKGGFDFTDIAANQSGIRLSNLVMNGSRADLARTLELMRKETDVIVAFEGIPSIMPRAEFETRFGDIDTPAYKAQLADIEDRISEVTIHKIRN